MISKYPFLNAFIWSLLSISSAIIIGHFIFTIIEGSNKEVKNNSCHLRSSKIIKESCKKSENSCCCLCGK